MPMSHDEIIGFAEAMLNAAQAGDHTQIRKYYAPDARLWLNTTQQWKSLDEHFSSISGFRSQIRNMKYNEARITPFEDGYVQQFRAQADTPTGDKIDIQACLIIRLQNGKIIQREEYFDSAAMTAAQM